MPSNELTVTITLQVPITHGDEVLTELTLTEPDLGGLMALDDQQGDMGRTLATIMACTGLPPSVLKQLKLRDLAAVNAASEKLVGEASRETGERRRPGSRIVSIGRQAN